MKTVQFINLFFFCLLITFLGCTKTYHPSYPTTTEERISLNVERAKQAIIAGNEVNAGLFVYQALELPGGEDRIEELFTEYPQSRGIYLSYLYKNIDHIASVYSARKLLKDINKNKEKGILSNIETIDLIDKLNIVVVEGNLNDLLEFYLGDNIDAFPQLKLPEHQEIIVNRTLKILQDTDIKRRPINELMEYVKSVGKDSLEGQKVEQMLPSLNIKRNEIEIVAEVFPKFAHEREKEVTLDVYFIIENADRIFIEDVFQAIRQRIKGIKWVKSSDNEVLTVIIEQIRNNEVHLPERKQTIFYHQHQVSFWNAALFMPVNSKYIFDEVSGGIEIEYGYIVSAIKENITVYEEIVRGNIKRTYLRCENARIQNVYGGETIAEFIANDDMQRRCSRPSNVSMEMLRKEVLSKIVDEVSKIPSIQAVQGL